MALKLSRVFAAKYRGTCAFCGTAIKKGDKVGYAGHLGLGHAGCRPTGVDAAADREYAKGLADYRTWKEERALFGDEMADRMEMERELRYGDY